MMMLGASGLLAQTTAAPAPNPEMRYYDFWPGTWVRVVNGRPDTAATRFRVRRGVHPAAFVEEWRLVDDAGNRMSASAFRAWDQVSSKWMYTWISDNALFQVWDGQKVGDTWYIVREFEVDTRAFFLGRRGSPVGRMSWCEEWSDPSTKGVARPRPRSGRVGHADLGRERAATRLARAR